MNKGKGIIFEVPTYKRLALAKGLWGWEPHKKQREWLMDESHVKCASCGRRWGKTESAIIDDLTTAIACPGVVIMNVAPTNDQVRLLFDPAKRLIEATPELAGSVCVASPHPRIEIGDSTILYYSAGEDGKNIRGHTAHRIRVDEAAYVKDAVVNAVLEPMRMDYDGQMILQGTPFGKNWFYQTYMQGQPGHDHIEGYSSYLCPSTDNTHTYAVTYVEQMRKKYGESSIHFRAEYLGEFVDTLGSVFPWVDISRCLYELSTRPPVLKNYVAGIDPALYSDYCSVIIGANDNGMCYIVDWDHFNRVGWNDTKERIYNKVSEYNALGVIDSTHGSTGDAVYLELAGGLFIDDAQGRKMTRPGLNLVPVSFTNKIKEELIKKLQVRMAQGLLRIPNNFRDLIDELKYFGYEMTPSGNMKYEGQGTYHDDLVIAFALMVSQVFGNYTAPETGVMDNPMCYANIVASIERMESMMQQMIIGNERVKH